MEFRRTHMLPFILVALLLLLQYRLWFEAGGIIDMIRLKTRWVGEQRINDKLKKRNDTLLLQVQHLRKNQDAIEMRARQELGMIKKGEVFYQVVKH